MELNFYQAECGDAARIKFLGQDGKYHNIIIDAGYERTFRHVLVDEINKIGSAGEVVDLWIISHIHDDHIGGAIKYLKAIDDGEAKDIVKSWFYNSPRPRSVKLDPRKEHSVSEAKSVSQGDVLQSYLLSNGKVQSMDITNSSLSVNFFGMNIVFLSPDLESLERLRSKYSAKVGFEKIEGDTVSLAKAPAANDYSIPVDKFDLKSWIEDESIENRSSIAFFTEYRDKRVLWLADAHPSVVVNKLKELGYSKGNPLICDCVKVTHHGSKGNNSDDLFEMICCSNYLISANGENTHCLPTKECIVRILKNANRSATRHYKFFFTYDNQLLRSMFSIDDKEIFKKLNFNVFFPENNAKMIRFASDSQKP